MFFVFRVVFLHTAIHLRTLALIFCSLPLAELTSILMMLQTAKARTSLQSWNAS